MKKYKIMDLVTSIICLIIPIVQRIIILKQYESEPLVSFAIFIEFIMIIPALGLLIFSIIASIISLNIEKNIFYIISQIAKILSFLYFLLISSGDGFISKSIIIYMIIPLFGIIELIILWINSIYQKSNHQ